MLLAVSPPIYIFFLRLCEGSETSPRWKAGSHWWVKEQCQVEQEGLMDIAALGGSDYRNVSCVEKKPGWQLYRDWRTKKMAVYLSQHEHCCTVSVRLECIHQHWKKKKILLFASLCSILSHLRFVYVYYYYYSTQGF